MISLTVFFLATSCLHCFVGPAYVGCYADHQSDRDMPHLTDFGQENNSSLCIDYCRSEGRRKFGQIWIMHILSFVSQIGLHTKSLHCSTCRSIDTMPSVASDIDVYTDICNVRMYR